jgi:hypothetical protein
MPFGIEELVIGAAIGATAASPTGRRWVRRGVVYGLAGVLTAYDRAAALAHGAAKGVRDGVNSLREEAAEANKEAYAQATPPPAATAKATAAAPPG